jgi:hypothetical protein
MGSFHLKCSFFQVYIRFLRTTLNPNFSKAKFAFRPPAAGLTPPEAARSADFSIEKSGLK